VGRTENPRVGGSTPSQATTPQNTTAETVAARAARRPRELFPPRLCQFCSTSPLAVLSGDLAEGRDVAARGLRLGLALVRRCELAEPVREVRLIDDAVAVEHALRVFQPHRAMMTPSGTPARSIADRLVQLLGRRCYSEPPEVA